MVKAQQVSADDIKVSDAAFAYLVLQKGKLDPLRGERALWLAEYQAGLQRNYDAIKSYLPRKPNGDNCPVVDIGSGLGGIDILLHRHYAGRVVPTLVDGVEDAPRMVLHRQTYNDMQVAAAFHADNGVEAIAYVDPRMKPLPPLAQPAFLVVSFGSWCFHYAPELYLDWALANAIKGATFIIDVRKDKPEYRDKLATRLDLKAIVHGAVKFDRCVFHAR